MSPAFAASKPAELLLLLLCRPTGVTRDEVGLAFWPDASSLKVKNSFHVMLHRLRRALGRDDWVASDRDRYRVASTVVVDFDAHRFQHGAQALLGTAQQGVAPNLDTVDHLLGLYDGEFLQGSSAGDWHLEVRERLRRLHGELIRTRAQLLEAEGRMAEAADTWRTLLGRDHLDDAACRALMLCEASRGRRIEALRVYEAFARLLDEELGAAPEVETRAVFDALRCPGLSS